MNKIMRFAYELKEIIMRYAVIGTGWIAEAYIEGARIAGNWELAAIFSRSREKGLAFGKKFGVGRVYTDLEALAADSSIAAVYIASPNALHYAQSRRMLEAGKHVICEKPITVTPKGCEALQVLAGKKGLVYMEAIMMLHLPQLGLVEKYLPQLGRICGARIDFSQLSSKYPAYLRGELPNIFNPEMATGSLMDLGIYCVYPALRWFGVPEKIRASAVFLPTGADVSCSAVFSYSDKEVILTCSKVAQGQLGTEILGDQGTLVIDSISKLTGIRFVTPDGESTPLVGDIPKAELMSGEARDFYRYITDPQGCQEEYAAASQAALAVSRVMAEIRGLAGIRFKEGLL